MREFEQGLFQQELELLESELFVAEEEFRKNELARSAFAAHWEPSAEILHDSSSPRRSYSPLSEVSPHSWVVMLWLRAFLDRTIPETMNSLPQYVQNVTPQIVSWSIPLAFGISVVVGIIFGIYSALRAAQMDPIEALLHE